jgi:hypothetical protein
MPIMPEVDIMVYLAIIGVLFVVLPRIYMLWERGL